MESYEVCITAVFFIAKLLGRISVGDIVVVVLKKNLNAPERITFSILVAISKKLEKTTSHGSQSRSWPAEEGKENKRENLAAHPLPPLPPRCSFGKNKIKKHVTHLHA